MGAVPGPWGLTWLSLSLRWSGFCIRETVLVLLLISGLQSIPLKRPVAYSRQSPIADLRRTESRADPELTAPVHWYVMNKRGNLRTDPAPAPPKTSNRESAAAFLGPRLTGIDLIGQCCLTVYERGEPLEGCASKMWCSHIWKFCDWKDLWVRVSGFVPRLFLGWWVDWWSKQSFLHANGPAKLEVKFSLTWVSLTIACSLNVALNVNARNI